MDPTFHFCGFDYTAGHRQVRFRYFMWGNEQKCEIWGTLTPRSSETVHCTKNLT